MTNRFKNNLYTQELLVMKNHQPCHIRNSDGTLFSGRYKTKILPQDLPEWYVRGRYNRCWGYLSTKGITDLRYSPNQFSNHFLKDDFLYIAYGRMIKDVEPPNDYSFCVKYSGFDEMVWGNEILSIVRGARQYSNYAISEIVQQLKEKKDWLVKTFPHEFGADKWRFDVDNYFEGDVRADFQKGNHNER